MAITLGTFTKFDNGAYTGTFKTLHVTAAATILPVEKMSDKAPDHRVYAGQRHEIGAGWSQVAKSSGETYLNLKIGAPEFGPTWVRCRLVKLEQPAEDGHPHRPLGTAGLITRIAPSRPTPRRGIFVITHRAQSHRRRHLFTRDPSRQNSHSAMPKLTRVVGIAVEALHSTPMLES